jgi:hypothetical protein
MIRCRIHQYCVLKPEVEAVGIFWTLLTFVPPEIALHAPIFTPYGPRHNAGKTMFLEVLSWLSRIRDPSIGPEVIVSPSAGIYRQMDLGPTLFVEEGQKIYQRDNVQEIFDASWNYGKTIYRIINGVNTPFRPFCQKAVAMIGIHDVPAGATRSRHIFCEVLPKVDTDEPRDKWRNRDDAGFKEIRAKSARWISDNLKAIDTAQPEMPQGFGNRLAANWRIVLTLADLVGGPWPKLLRDAACKLRRDNDEDQPWHIRALIEVRRYIREVHKENANLPISTTKFAEWLLENPEWHACPPGRKITAVQISVLMGKWYHVRTEQIGPKTKRIHGWKRPTDFAEYFRRVLNDPLKLAYSLTRKRAKKAAR